MALIKSISGIRGTVGGKAGDNLTPIDLVRFTSAFAQYLKNEGAGNKVVIGRDARVSGPMVNQLVTGTLQAMGMNVVDLDMATTPTVEMAVVWEQAAGGMILTASHNPGEWNALKLLNNQGEFISADVGKTVLELAAKDEITFSSVNKLGIYDRNDGYLDKHIEAILKLPLVDVKAINKAEFKIVVDAVNSVGGIAVPKLLQALGVAEIVELYCKPDGRFPHNPEPLPDNLTAISNAVDQQGADLGIVVDPDVDRLALVNEDGTMFGEEYTLVAIADYVLSHTSGNTVSNLSSTRALKDVTEKRGGEYTASAVGEVNVVAMMKETNAVIGGEGNGGVIYPELHYGRDALVGIALFLSHLARYGKSCSMLRAQYPNFHMAKEKIQLAPDIDVDAVLASVKRKYSKQPLNEMDGLKIEFDTDWVHLRKSNTEPIIRIYTESTSETAALNLARKLMEDIREVIKG